jgi:hypothetical protein
MPSELPCRMRKEGDSNPRTALGGYTLSSCVHSCYKSLFISRLWLGFMTFACRLHFFNRFHVPAIGKNAATACYQPQGRNLIILHEVCQPASMKNAAVWLALQPLNVAAVQVVTASECLKAAQHAPVYQGAYRQEEPFDYCNRIVLYLFHVVCFLYARLNTLSSRLSRSPSCIAQLSSSATVGTTPHAMRR